MQLDLLTADVAVTRPHKRARQTSRAIYRRQRDEDTRRQAEGRETRKAMVLRCLAAYWNRYQESPTARELFAWMQGQGEPVDDINSVRPKLFYLEQDGLIEARGERVCAESGERVRTWAVKELGS